MSGLGMLAVKLALVSSTALPVHALVSLIVVLGCGTLPIHA